VVHALTMKAAVNTRYGSPDVVQVREVPRPEPQAGEVLVRVHATTVSRTDCGQLRAHPFFVRLWSGLTRPKRTILGMDFAGEVEAVGPGVTSVALGDRIFGLTPGGYGGHAQYLCLSEGGAFAHMPGGLSFAQTVVCEGALYASTYLEAFGIKPGQSVLVYGASGAIGTAAVQLAKSCGAEVTAVVSARNLDLARSLGADEVVDYETQDYAAIGGSFDFVLDAVGKTSYFHCRHLLKPHGVFAATDLGPHKQNVLLLLWTGIFRGRKIIFPLPKSTKAFVEFLQARMEAGEFRAVIDRTYPLEDVREAYRYVEGGRKTGIVVIETGS
jgi:NADPH:quinone reductase-like Zn-dependent oxidoreductase